MLSFKYSSDHIKVDETNTVLTNIIDTSFKSNTCFIGNWIESDEDAAHHLTVRLNKLSSAACFFIGLSPSDEQTGSVSMEECCPGAYGYCGNGKIYFDDKELGTFEDCTDDDTLCLVYNVPARTLSLQINDNDAMTLFTDILSVDYKFAVSLSYSGDQCTISRHHIRRGVRAEIAAEREAAAAVAAAKEARSQSARSQPARSESAAIVPSNDRATSTELDMTTSPKAMAECNLINGARMAAGDGMPPNVAQEESSSDDAVETDQMVTGGDGADSDDESDGIPVKETRPPSGCGCCIL